jgi:uncharacterized protein YjiK
MKPPRDFGEEAMEKLRIRKEKEKRMKLVLKIAAIVVCITLVAFFWSDLKTSLASASSGKSKKEKADIKNNTGETPFGGITVIRKWDMPDVLNEISGMTYVDGERFACVQDEMGIIYIYNTSTSAIEKEIPFGKTGDYEGLALVSNTAWVVRADGKLFEVNDINSNKPVVKEYATHLTAKHNIEGLCYDKKNNRLLLAIKDSEPGNVNYKGIYAFDLATRSMPKQPVFKIDLGDEVFSGGNSKKNKKEEIMPSDIAIHPVTGDMYITDGPKARLLVTDSTCTIKHFYQLDKKDFEQPEGLTFKPTGELFISNEGAKNAGNILNVKIDSE